MKQTKSLVLTGLFFLLLTPVFAQINLSGKIYDKQNDPMVGAHVLLEGEHSYAKVADKDGSFLFGKIPEGDYILTISYLGYEHKSIELTDLKSDKKLGKITIQQVNTQLEDVEVEAKVPLATVRQDTVEYNADAYTTNPDADADDLVKKMPGITVSSGTVTAHGEEVIKVYVDGKPFFDQDPMLALKSLPAEVVQKVEVYDEKSEQAKFTGFDDGETTKVMNIVTRSNMKNGKFGKFYAGGGYADKYKVGGMLNIFKGSRRISIVGQSNNINEQNFGSEDLLGISGGGGGRGPGGASQNFMVGQQSGVSTTHAIGINYTDAWGDKIKVTGSYFFNQSMNETEQSSIQQYFSADTSDALRYTEDDLSHSTNLNHRLSMRLEYNMNDKNRIMLEPRISFQGNIADGDVLATSYLGDSLLSQTRNVTQNDRQGYDFSNMFLWMHNFEKKGRSLSLNSRASASDNRNAAYQATQKLNLTTLELQDSLDQFSDGKGPANGVDASLVYTEPLGSSSQFSISSGVGVNFDHSDRYVYDWVESEAVYSALDSSLSNVLKSTYTTYQAGLGYRYNLNKIRFNLGVNYQISDLSGDQSYPVNDQIQQRFSSILPSLRFRYGMSRTQNLNLFYRTSTQAPGASQLQTAIDNSNPLKITTGNPNLREAYKHNVSLRYTTTNKARTNVFYVMGNLNYTQNYMANNTVYVTSDSVINGTYTLQAGGQLIKPVNVDRYLQASLNTSYGFPLKPIKSNLNVNLDYSYTHTPGIYNNVANYSDNHKMGAGLTLSSNISENIDFTITSGSNYNQAKSSLQSSSDNNYFSQATSANLTLIFWKGLVFRTSLSSNYYLWTQSGETQAYNLWNMELGKKFGAKQRTELKLSLFDVLGQNNSISRNVTDTYIEDTQSNTLQQYVMLGFSYKLRHFKMM